MCESTKQRREKDEFRLAEMKKEMSRLEAKLEAEIKKRIEMNKSLQNYCDEQVAQMTANFEALLDERAKQVATRLDQLAEEISKLETLVEDEKRNIPLMIENKTNELTQKLVAFMDAFDAERRRRADQEAALLNRLSTHEHATTEAFERERVRRKSQMRMRCRLLLLTDSGYWCRTTASANMLSSKMRSTNTLRPDGAGTSGSLLLPRKRLPKSRMLSLRRRR